MFSVLAALKKESFFATPKKDVAFTALFSYGLRHSAAVQGSKSGAMRTRQRSSCRWSLWFVWIVRVDFRSGKGGISLAFFGR